MSSNIDTSISLKMKQVKKLLQNLNQFMQEQDITGTVTYKHEDSHMVRCGRSQISLNVSEQGEKYFIALQKGKRKIEGSTTAQLDEIDKLKSFVLSLQEKLQFMPEVNHSGPLEPIAEAEVGEKLDISKVDPSILNIESAIMVDLFKQVENSFSDQNVEISGAFSAGIQSYAIINTLVEQAITYQGSDYNIELVVQLLDHNKKELRVSDVGCSLQQFESTTLINHLKKMFLLKTKLVQQDIKSGEYDVVFYADAFAELTNYMAYLTLQGETFEYGMGMLQKGKHQLGDKIFAEDLTIIDDPADESLLFNRPIGQNGIKRNRFPLITKGVLANMFYSAKEDCDRFNVQVNNDVNVAGLKVLTGDGPENFDEMVKTCIKPTLFISYIHYMNFTNPAKGEFTGSSRFGTFLIENGKIASQLKNQRINDSYHNIFNNIEWLSSTLTHINTSNTYDMRNATSIACPQFVKVNNVNITGSSQSA
ncbi:metallopeptidase TldD-related protein [Psychromonas sp. KJ10-10]|uniref:metallopeptidase TldD-related protein n=1 Tax=Psychromonas sp. KJ10-10 TaxID=3391823 RepID=UPI0039B6C01A